MFEFIDIESFEMTYPNAFWCCTICLCISIIVVILDHLKKGKNKRMQVFPAVDD